MTARAKVAQVTRILDPARLLERAVDGLFPLVPATLDRPWPSLSAWLVMRQGGLRDDLYRLAAGRGVAGWFDPTICLFTELRARWSASVDRPALSEPERHAILSRLIDGKGRGCFGRVAVPDAWVPVVDAFIGEMVAEGIEPARFAEAMHRIAADQFDTARAESLGDIYAAWHATLDRHARSDGRDAKVRLSRDIEADPRAFAERLGARRDVRIVGLADLRGGWRHLLRALVRSDALDRVEILTSAALHLPDDLGFDVDDTDREQGPAPQLVAWEAPDPAREAELIAVRVRELIDAGTPPTRIAVVARQARPAVDTVSAALARVGVPVTARRRSALGESTPARALLALLNVARERWSRHSVVELAEHPLLATGLDARILNQVGYSRVMTGPESWHAALTELRRRAVARERAEDEPETRRSVLPASATVDATIAHWQVVVRRLAEDPIGGERTLVEWCEWARRMLADARWGIGTALDRPASDAATWRLERRARDEIDATLVAWRDALGSFGSASSRLDAARFHDRLSLMLARDVVTQPVTDFGVVVSEALAAGWRAYDHVFVLGLNAGEFPRRPAAGQLIDARERAALIHAGLPLDPPDAWRAREDELFRVLCAAPRDGLTLSWTAVDATGAEVARSVFIEERLAAIGTTGTVTAQGTESLDDALERTGVLTRHAARKVLIDDFPIVRDAAALAHARDVARRENERSEAPTPWNGAIETDAEAARLASRYDERYEWSASQLEQAAKCRWQWFGARQLGLESLSDAGDELEPTVSGTIRHEALHRFFAREVATRGGPVRLMATDRVAARAAIATALDEAWSAAAARGEWLGPPVLHAIAKAELARGLQAYVDWEIQYNEDAVNRPRTNAAKVVHGGALEGEVRFGNVTLRAAEVSFRLRGTIDRIDQGVDARFEGADRYLIAIDYKSSRSSTPAGGRKEGWADGVVLQVPLYAAALAQLRPDAIVSRMEYRTLRAGGVEHQLALHTVKGGEVDEVPEAVARLHDALAKAGALIERIRGGELPAAPTPSSGCPPFCPARDVCRIPGGPRDVR